MNPVKRLASALILGDLRQAPLERGKWRLMRLFGPSLLVELEPGLFMRLLGISAVERGMIRSGWFEPDTVRAFAAMLDTRTLINKHTQIFRADTPGLLRRESGHAKLIHPSF
jgi:hypothetical protein